MRMGIIAEQYSSIVTALTFFHLEVDHNMASKVKSLSPIANAPLVSASHDHKGEVEALSHEVPSYPSSGSDKNDIEDNDHKFEQVIQRDGQDVLVRWTKEEERKVVRKADFRFLPLFTVCFKYNQSHCQQITLIVHRIVDVHLDGY